MAYELNIEIGGTCVRLSLLDANGREVANAAWEDKRDLSTRLFQKAQSLLKRKKIPLRQLERVNFTCDSPYFARKGKWTDLTMEDIDSTGKCGFTTWQTGEIISGVVNFALKK